MVIVSFQVVNNLNKICFFQEIFGLANINIDIVMKIFFFILNNINILFANKMLICRFHMNLEALPNIWQVKIIYKTEFAKVKLDKNIQVFVIYVFFLYLDKIIIYLA